MNSVKLVLFVTLLAFGTYANGALVQLIHLDSSITYVSAKLDSPHYAESNIAYGAGSITYQVEADTKHVMSIYKYNSNNSYASASFIVPSNDTASNPWIIKVFLLRGAVAKFSRPDQPLGEGGAIQYFNGLPNTVTELIMLGSSTMFGGIAYGEASGYKTTHNSLDFSGWEVREEQSGKSLVRGQLLIQRGVSYTFVAYPAWEPTRYPPIFQVFIDSLAPNNN